MKSQITLYMGFSLYESFNKELTQLYYNNVISSINWNQNKKYFNDKKKK